MQFDRNASAETNSGSASANISRRGRGRIFGRARRQRERPTTTISVSQAMINAANYTGAVPIDAEPGTHEGRAVFNVYLRFGQRTTCVRVDAASGIVLAVRTDATGRHALAKELSA